MAVLFSPLGSGDRTGVDFKDEGPILHILRNYPDIEAAYLYLSAEELSLERKDSFIEYVNLVRSDITCTLIERPNLTDPHHFDTIYYCDYAKVLDTIASEHPGEQIYVNLSSGTPAMKSALMVLVEFGTQSVMPLQVDNPKYSTGVRVHEVPTSNFHRLVTVDNIKKLIDRYDYSAALELAQNVLNPEQLKLVEGLVDRYELRTGQAREKLGSLADTLIGSNTPTGNTYEYLQYLEALYEKEEWAGFLRATDPAIVNVLLEVIDAFTPYSRQDLVSNEVTTALNLSKVTGDADLQRIFKTELDQYKGNAEIFIKWSPLKKLAQDHLEGSEPSLVNTLEPLATLQKSRNKYVHSYQIIDRSQVRMQVDRWREMLNTLFSASMKKANKNLPPSDSYRQLNAAIIARLN